MDLDEQQDKWRYWAFSKSIKDYGKRSYQKGSFRCSYPDIDWGPREERPKYDDVERARRNREDEWRASAETFTPLWAEAMRVAQILSLGSRTMGIRRDNQLYSYLMLKTAELFQSGKFDPTNNGAKSYLRDHLNRREKDWRRGEWRVENKTQAYDFVGPVAEAIPAVDERIGNLPADIRIIAEHILIGRTQAQIAAELGVTERTIRRRIEQFRKKYDVSNGSQRAA